LSYFLGFRIILAILAFPVYFGHFNMSEYFCHFLGSNFQGYFDHFGVFEIILVIFGVCCYFGHYGVSRVILVILEFSRLFWSFLGFEEYFGLYGIFEGYFGYIRVFRVILVILEFSGLFWCFRCILVILIFSGYFNHFGGPGVILIILKVSGLFWSFLEIF
jgi:hypothetical protein